MPLNGGSVLLDGTNKFVIFFWIICQVHAAIEQSAYKCIKKEY